MDLTLDNRKTIKEKIHPVRITRFEQGEYSIGTILISPLLPFKATMIKQLQQRGFNTDRMNFKSIVALYYNEFVSNKENKKSFFVPINAYEFRNNVAFKLKPSDSFQLDERNRIYFTDLEDVTKNIIGQFKIAKAKKKKALSDSFEPSSVLSDEEILQANHADLVEQRLEYKALNLKKFTWGDLKGLLLVALIIWFIFYIFE
jgi:hypothetical protein